MDGRIQQPLQLRTLNLQEVLEPSALFGLPCEHSSSFRHLDAIEAHILKLESHDARIQAMVDALATFGC